MVELHWTLDWQPTAADLATIREGVVAHGRTLAGDDVQYLACFVRDGKHLVAGASGRLELGRLFVEYLWVEEIHRGQGIGSRLLSTLEEAAAFQGCRDALLDTLLGDTAEMYSRRGYRLLASIPDYVPGFTRWVLLKPLA